MSPDPRLYSASRRPPSSGISLVGLAAALAVLSVCTTIAVPLLQERLRNARAAETARLLTAFARTFAAAAKSTGDWPVAPAAPGELPPAPGLEAIASEWQRSTPIGGYFQWIAHSPQAGSRIRAGITFSPTPEGAVSADRATLTAVDALLDDGNLATGKFRLGYRARPFLILEP